MDLASAGVDVAQGFATGDKSQFGDAGLRVLASAPIIGSVVPAGKLGKAALQTVGVGAPAAAGVMRALQPDTPETDSDKKDELVKKSIEAQKGTQQPETEKPKSDKEEEEEPFDISRMYNTRLISHAPLQQFRSLQTASFQQELVNTTDMLVEQAIAKGAKYVTDLVKSLFKKKPTTVGRATQSGDGDSIELAPSTPQTRAGVPRSQTAQTDQASRSRRGRGRDDEDKPTKEDKPTPARSFLKYATGAGLGSAALLSAGIAAPALLGGMFGAGQTDAGGQPLVPGSGTQAGADSGVGAVGNVLDRLTSAYGYIPGFNPAGLAIQTLGKRVGAV